MKHRSAIVSLLLTILILPAILIASPVQAHGGNLFSGSYKTDNLFRFGLSRGMIVDAEVNNDPSDPCASWHNPPNENLDDCSSGVCGCTMWQKVNERLIALGRMADGAPITYVPSTGQEEFFTHTATEQNASTNNSAFYVEWFGNVPATKAVFAWYGTNTGIGTYNVTFQFKNVNTFARNLTQTGYNCGDTTTHSLSAEFNRTIFDRVEMFVNTSSCQVTGGQVLVFSWTHFSLYSVGYVNDAIAYTDQALEFGDYIAERATNNNILVGTSASDPDPSVNMSGTLVTQEGLTYLESGPNVMFTSGQCFPLTGSNDCWSVKGGGVIWPNSYMDCVSGCQTDCVAGLDIQYRGHSFATTNHKSISVWSVFNQCAGPVSIKVSGFLDGYEAGTNSGVTTFNDFHTWFANDYPGYTTVPSRGVLATGAIAGGPATVAMAYVESTPSALNGPLITTNYYNSIVTPPFGQALGKKINFDLDNATSVATSCTTMATCAITATVPAEYYFGNVLYFGLLVENSTMTGETSPDMCNNNVRASINNLLVSPALVMGAWKTSVKKAFCAWIIQDSGVNGAIPKDTLGNNQYLDNAKAVTFTASITSDQWPAAMKAPNGPSSNGYTLRAVTQIQGYGADAISCNNTYYVCYGNHDTTGTSASPIRFNFTAYDGTNLSAPTLLSNMDIFETVSASQARTNSVGNANVSLPAASFRRFTMSKLGFMDASLNVSNVFTSPVEVTVYLSRNFSSPRQVTVCDAGAKGGLVCVIQFHPFDITGGTCLLINGTTGGCKGSDLVATKQYRFSCPMDISTVTTTYIRNVTATESTSGQSKTLLISTVAPVPLSEQESCLGAVMTGVTSSASVTFSRAGYRTLTFNADWLNNQLIYMLPRMKTGTGSQVATVSVNNYTGIVPGTTIQTQYSIIILTDTAPAGVNPISSGTSGSFSAGLTSVGCTVGLCDAAGKAIWGLLLVSFIIFGVAVAWYSTFRDIPPLIVTGPISVGAFFVVGFVGLFPAWLLFLIAIVLVLAIVKTLASGATSQQAE